MNRIVVFTAVMLWCGWCCCATQAQSELALGDENVAGVALCGGEAAYGCCAEWCAPALGCGCFYAESFGGFLLQPDQEFNDGEFRMDEDYSLGAGVGMHLGHAFDVEVEYFHTQSGYSGFRSQLIVDSVMVSGLYNVSIGKDYRGLGCCCYREPTLYFGSGLGAIRVKYDGEDQFPDDTGEDWVTGYQLVTGLRGQLICSLEGFIEYRFVGLVSKAEIEDNNVGYDSHNYLLGLRYNF